MRIFLILFSLILYFFLFSKQTGAQTFGRNKVTYDKKNFEILSSEFFDIYYYDLDKEDIYRYKLQAERWRNRLNSALNYTLSPHNPLILYKEHPDFQQTNVLGGEISIGVGGVTESQRNRVILPFQHLNKGTEHVLGHELVHAYQYDIILNTQGIGASAFRNLPLWIIEGMAEYLSIGQISSQTAMWLRDASLNNDIPTLEDLSVKSHKYFPYRYGHAFWAFIAGTWGEEIIPVYFRNIAQVGIPTATLITLGLSVEALSDLWRETFEKKSLENTKGKQQYGEVGTEIISKEKKFGNLNLTPSLSPNGDKVAFFSEKSNLAIQLYVADASSGKKLKKFNNTLRSGHFDDVAFLESSGSWSPDGKKFVYVVIAGGDNVLNIVNYKSKKVDTIIRIPSVTSIKHPAWSSNGTRIAFSGMVKGTSDIYVYDIKNKKVEQITNDIYSDVMPHWSKNDDHIVFSSDRGSTSDSTVFKFSDLKICSVDVEKKKVTQLSIFKKGNHIDPHFANNDEEVFFVASPDGINNVYKKSLSNGEVKKITDVSTGVSGITNTSPTLSVSLNTNDMVFSVFEKGKYVIYKISYEEHDKDSLQIEPSFLEEEPNNHKKKTFSLLPFSGDSIQSYTNTLKDFSFHSVDSFFYYSEYMPSLTLAGIASGGIGFGITNQYGSLVSGSVQMLFQDILSSHSLYGGLSVNGELEDIGGGVFYLNQKHQINYGAITSYTPYTYRYSGRLYNDTWVNSNGDSLQTISDNYITDRYGILEFSGVTFFPLTKTYRWQLTSGVKRYTRNRTLEKFSYSSSGSLLDRSKNKIELFPPVTLLQTGLFFIGDNSTFGYTSPIKGFRFRVGGSYNTIDLDYSSFEFSFRKYFYTRPLTFALQATHYANYIKSDENSLINDLSLGRLGYETPVRGYEDIGTNRTGGGTTEGTEQIQYTRTYGQKIFFFKSEIRYLIFGTPELGSLARSNTLKVQIAPFFDMGFAYFDDPSEVVFSFDTENLSRIPITSLGMTSRVNLANLLVLEFYYSFMFQHPTKDKAFGFNIIPGW